MTLGSAVGLATACALGPGIFTFLCNELHISPKLLYLTNLTMGLVCPEPVDKHDSV